MAYVDAQTHQRLLEVLYAKEKEQQGASNHVPEENRGTCSRNPFTRNNGTNTPPRSPRAAAGACSSPLRQSHHDSDDEITSKDVIKFQQDGVAQKLMLRALEENGDQYF